MIITRIALHALQGEREDAEHDEAEVTHRGIRHQLLEVGLDESDERTVQNPHDRQREHDGADRRVDRRLREERQGEAQESEGPHFEHDPGQDHRLPVGASTCASGSHVWNGNIGTLIAKARKNAPNSHRAATGVTLSRVRRSS